MSSFKCDRLSRFIRHAEEGVNAEEEDGGHHGITNRLGIYRYLSLTHGRSELQSDVTVLIAVLSLLLVVGSCPLPYCLRPVFLYG